MSWRSKPTSIDLYLINYDKKAESKLFRNTSPAKPHPDNIPSEQGDAADITVVATLNRVGKSAVKAFVTSHHLFFSTGNVTGILSVKNDAGADIAAQVRLPAFGIPKLASGDMYGPIEFDLGSEGFDKDKAFDNATHIVFYIPPMDITEN